MSERSVKPVIGVRSLESGLPTRGATFDRAEHAAVREHKSDVERSTKQIEAEKERAKYPSNISIHFNVDAETNRLVVVLTERESGRLIRTIPASEFEKLKAGDLLKLKA